MANLTISDLKNELITHGVELPPSTAKKEDYVQLYEKNISTGGEKAKIDFSSDDEEVSIPMAGKVSKKKVSRKSELTNGTNGHADSNGDVNDKEMLTEENSLVVGDVDVATLTDEQLAEKLKEYDVAVGPIVESTRAVYRKKLSILMRGEDNVDATGKDVEKKQSEKIQSIVDETLEEEFKDGEFSADDEDDPYQPSCVILPSSSFQSPNSQNDSSNHGKSNDSTEYLLEASKLSVNSPLSNSIYTNIRQRFDGSNRESAVTDGRYTPTPRRSIHSYKVTETSKETVTKMKDGTISRDFDYKKTTSNSQDEIGGVRKTLKLLPPLFLGLIIMAVGYYITVSRK